MRVKYTLFNISAGLGSQLIIVMMSFISRTVFIHSLGIEYLGINMLFTSMLAMLSLAEAGIGQSIVYNLYKPIANNDRPTIVALMSLYKNAYWCIAGVVLLLGLCMMPFLGFFIKETTVNHLHVIYLIFLFNTAVPYFFVYKHSFLNVNQKNYIVTSVFMVSTIISTLSKIAILVYTQNYILFLIVESVISIITSIGVAWVVDRMYPYLKQKAVEKIDSELKGNLVRNMKAIVLQSIGAYFIFGVDSVLISSFIGVVAVGLYSNYRMLIDICRNLVNQVFNNMYHSVGNLVAKETKEKVYNIYKVTMLINFWLYSFFAILLYIVIEPFITLWIGSEFLMGQMVLIVLMFTFYERGMRNSITTIKTTAGIFHEDRYAPLCQAGINLTVSIILVQYIGITGIFIGTLISSLAVPFWFTPKLVYRKVFNKPLRYYYVQYIYYFIVGSGAYIAASTACSFIPGGTFMGLLMKGLVCLVLINMLYIVIFFRTDEFKYLWGIVNSILHKLPKIRSNKMKGL